MSSATLHLLLHSTGLVMVIYSIYLHDMNFEIFLKDREDKH